MTIPDFGEHTYEYTSGGNKVTLTSKYKAPGLTMHDLLEIFEKASMEGNHLAGNPAKWPTNKGINAVVDAVLGAIYDNK